MAEPRYLITPEEAMIWTGRTNSTIRGWSFRGRIAKYGVGRGMVRYDVRELPPKTIGPNGEVIPGALPEMP